MDLVELTIGESFLVESHQVKLSIAKANGLTEVIQVVYFTADEDGYPDYKYQRELLPDEWERTLDAMVRLGIVCKKIELNDKYTQFFRNWIKVNAHVAAVKPWK